MSISEFNLHIKPQTSNSTHSVLIISEINKSYSLYKINLADSKINNIPCVTNPLNRALLEIKKINHAAVLIN